MKRREFLKFSSAGVAGSMLSGIGLISWVPRANAAVIDITYHITEGFIDQVDGVSVYFRGFSSTANNLNVPGEPIIAQAGDTVRVTVVNTLGTDHSFVIDDVVDSGVIAGGTSKTIEFVPNKAGSFLYYDKLNAPYNRLSGLHGGFAVMPSGSNNELFPGSATFVQQYFWLLNDIDPVWHEAIRVGDTPGTKFIPRYFTINGRNMRVPGHPEYSDKNRDSGYATDTRIVGSIGDRTLIRLQHAGMCTHSMHFHANHVEWLATNGQARQNVWKKDVVRLPNNKGSVDVIYPFEIPPDSWPPVSTGHYPMHSHDEMTQTAGGGFYQFGLATTIEFK